MTYEFPRKHRPVSWVLHVVTKIPFYVTQVYLDECTSENLILKRQSTPDGNVQEDSPKISNDYVFTCYSVKKPLSGLRLQKERL